MKLLELKLLNFKGIRNFTFSPDGEEANIYGDNRTGKTTLKDAFLWLLFGKNSRNQKEFDIKTHDENRQTIPGIDHEVSAKLELDPGKRPVDLRRVYYEKWTKKRGSTTKEFTGHTTDYYIDGVPTNEKEYKEFISEIINENTFRLLIDPYYFAETIPWPERRSLLFKVCGDISDKDIIESNPDLTELAGLLNGRTIEQHKKVIISKKRNINQELDNIPVRIDEANRAISNGNGDQADESELAKQIESIKTDIGKKHQEKLSLQQGGGIPEKQKALAEVENQIFRYRFDYEAKLDNSLSILKKELRDIEAKMENIDRKYSSEQKIYDSNDEEADRIENELKQMREQWHRTDEEKFKFGYDMTCPKCGFDLMHDVRDNALADFNKTKSEALERINTKGVALKEKAGKLRQENKVITEYITNLQAERAKLDEQATGYDNKVDALRATREDYASEKEYIKLIGKKVNLEAEIGNLKDGLNTEAISAINEKIEAAEKHLAGAEGSLSQIRQARAIKSRIEDLKKQERTLAKEYERLEKEMRLIEQFTTMKAEMVEENINRKFKLAQFKLFNQNINGSLDDCCDVTDEKGVPYSSDLSNSERSNIGLDIINTLSEHYKFAPPIFVDNAESITDIVRTKGQQIKLYVQAGQETLKILTA